MQLSNFGHTTHEWIPTWKMLSKGSFRNLGSHMKPTFSWNHKYIFFNPWLHTFHLNIVNLMVLYLAFFVNVLYCSSKYEPKQFQFDFTFWNGTYDSLSWQWLFLFCTCNIIWNVIIVSWYIVNTIHSKKFQLSFQVLVFLQVTSMMGSLVSKLFPYICMLSTYCFLSISLHLYVTSRLFP